MTNSMLVTYKASSNNTELVTLVAT